MWQARLRASGRRRGTDAKVARHRLVRSRAAS
jgi:hypothetical protein